MQSDSTLVALRWQVEGEDLGERSLKSKADDAAPCTLRLCFVRCEAAEGSNKQLSFCLWLSNVLNRQMLQISYWKNPFEISFFFLGQTPPKKTIIPERFDWTAPQFPCVVLVTAIRAKHTPTAPQRTLVSAHSSCLSCLFTCRRQQCTSLRGHFMQLYNLHNSRTRSCAAVLFLCLLAVHCQSGILKSVQEN